MTNFSGRISVFGGREVSDEDYDVTVEIGKKLAEENYLVFCGGGNGVMEAISKGVKRGGGTCIGILKGITDEEANDFVSLAIPTGIGIGRNVILAYNCDAAIAISGKYGTLSEIAYALSLDKKVVGYNTWKIDNVDIAYSPEEVIKKINMIMK
ncbi:MAG: TIGR00725 family protein [Candidatus Marinimicrobia bacterium]|nr:TIGR00725 family protein [Candidatus Neomarinimicrobiota bacterium]